MASMPHSGLFTASIRSSISKTAQLCGEVSILARDGTYDTYHEPVLAIDNAVLSTLRGLRRDRAVESVAAVQLDGMLV